MISKSDFLKFLDAPLHMWAYKHGGYDSTGIDPYRVYLGKQGYEVETLAKIFLSRLLEREAPGSEISFQVELEAGGFRARIDALVYNTSTKKHDLYEIKSSTSVHAEHEYDVTFQYLVAREKLELGEVYLVRINREFRKAGEIDVENFFVVENMAESIAKLKDEVELLRQAALELSLQNQPPKELHCFDPKSCPCNRFCHPSLGEFPVYDLYGARKETYQKLLELGVGDVGEIPEDFELTGHQERQIKSRKQSGPIIDTDGIMQELELLKFPLYFLDFETFAPAIPLFDRYKPYQSVVFQFSLHVLKEESAELEHNEFLVTDQNEPSEVVAKQLIDAIGTEGSVVVWNKSFESARNRELGQLQPQYAKQLSQINARMYDLMDPFRKGYYADYRFHGSFSIKNVLPVLVPELQYKDMAIAEGTTALLSWYQLTHDPESEVRKDGEKRNKLISDLLEYCKLDTLAMVRIYQYMLGLTS